MSKIYQLKITLKAVKPPIWRRLELPANLKLNDFYKILMHTMPWGGYHLWCFEANGQEYMGDEESAEEMGTLLASKYKLSQFLSKEGEKGLFTYDFGDNWEHEILLEKIIFPEPGVAYPRCTAGKRNCPPDDCGGPWGYPDFLQAISDPAHPEHEDMLEWIGGEFDPEEFDLEKVNQRLH